MAVCARPGCRGQILDGYCDVCGVAPKSASPPAPPRVSPVTGGAPGAPTAPPGAAGGPCVRADCGGGGWIEEDGYCNNCGRPPVPGGGTAERNGAATGAPVEGEPCERPGCGRIVDGFCDVCGMAPSGGSRRTAGRNNGGPGPASSGASPTGTASSVSQETSAVRRPAAGTGSSPVTTGSPGNWGNVVGGLVDVPSVPLKDPRSVVLTEPQVLERKRFCASCDHPVGRSRDGRPGRTEGHCPNCGARYSFTPKLWPGDLVAGQYLVAGCIAHGGMGWVYLAQDKHLDDRWVVLKGLLDSQDSSAMAAAIAERRFLIEVTHPNIVTIHNFVQHEDASYIVMEYVGGESLREVRNRYRERHGVPMPVTVAIAHILEILPAFVYLHRRGLLFCDFKPDNVIQTDDHLKLIDLGGVRAIDDDDSDPFGTVGYQAPEVPERGTSIASDLYTVARTLAVLSFDFAGFQDRARYATSLPPAHEVPAFGRYESFHQFMLKATSPDPGARFQSAGEMAGQLLGVLRQVVAIDGGSPASAPSLLFSGELGHGSEESTWQELPVPTIDPFDPAATLLATAAMSGPDQAQAILRSAPQTAELAFHLARMWMDEGELARAEAVLDAPEAHRAGWRVAWWRGVLQLAADCPRNAHALFAAVAAQLPGELAPRLALAVSYERSARARTDPEERHSDLTSAAHYYEVVSATDPAYASACFGLSRVRLDLGDRAGAAAALRRIPSASSAHQDAQLALCRLWCAEVGGVRPDLSELISAAGILDQLRTEPSVRLPLGRDLQTQALALVASGQVAEDPSVRLAGVPLDEASLRSSLEITYRSLAKLAHGDQERIELVDLANAHRPRTLT